MSDALSNPTSGGSRLPPHLALPLKIVAGAAIPTVATLIFNLLNFFVDNYRNPQPPEFGDSIYDVAVGCAFAILGICFSNADRETTLKMVVLLVALILAVLAGDVLYLAYHWNRLGLIFAIDFLAFVGLAWAIAKAE